MGNLRAKISTSLISSAIKHGTVRSIMKGAGGKSSQMLQDLFNERGKTGGSEPGKGLEPGGGKLEDESSWAKENRKMIKDKKTHLSARLGKHSAKHPGFKKIQSKIEHEGYSHKIAGAILADRSRGSSAAAHKLNPRLSRVKG